MLTGTAAGGLRAVMRGPGISSVPDRCMHARDHTLKHVACRETGGPACRETGGPVTHSDRCVDEYGSGLMGCHHAKPSASVLEAIGMCRVRIGHSRVLACDGSGRADDDDQNTQRRGCGGGHHGVLRCRSEQTAQGAELLEPGTLASEV